MTFNLMPKVGSWRSSNDGTYWQQFLFFLLTHVCHCNLQMTNRKRKQKLLKTSSINIFSRVSQWLQWLRKFFRGNGKNRTWNLLAKNYNRSRRPTKHNFCCVFHSKGLFTPNDSVTYTVTMTLKGSIFDHFERHSHGQNGMHTHFVRQHNIWYGDGNGVACCERALTDYSLCRPSNMYGIGLDVSHFWKLLTLKSMSLRLCLPLCWGLGLGLGLGSVSPALGGVPVSSSSCRSPPIMSRSRRRRRAVSMSCSCGTVNWNQRRMEDIFQIPGYYWQWSLIQPS